jgi:hypothetical protein
MGFKLNLAAMAIADNPVADDQSETGSGAHAFGGEKWLKHPRLDFHGNPGAIVDDFHHELVIFPASADADFSLAVYGIYRVVD